MKRRWSITLSRSGYKPQLLEVVSPNTIETGMSDTELGEAIIQDHLRRSRRFGARRLDYCIENYGDELRIEIISGLRWRLLVNLQFEGFVDEYTDPEETRL